MAKLVLATCKRAVVLTSAFAIGVAVLPGTAHAGFFESLFGVGLQQQAAPTYSHDAPFQDTFGRRPREIHHQRKHVVRDDKPVLQKTTDIWHDKTLRDGDAVMMADGLHVYDGPNGQEPTVGGLPRIDDADVSKKKRAILVAMDTTRNDPLKAGLAPDTIASGRSAAVASAVVSGYSITDARGKSVRYVGP